MKSFFYDLLESFEEIASLLHSQEIQGLFRYEGRGAGGDLSSKIDLKAEEIYIQRLQKYGQIISEESGVIGEGERKIILDPIDGSDNLLSSFPYYGTSVALQEEEEVIFSAIVNFATGEFFVKGEDFYKKGYLFQKELFDIKINNFSKIGLFEKAYQHPEVVAELKISGLKFRSPGAVALSLAYARYVAFVLFKGEIREYDIAAGMHQCEGLFCHIDEENIIISKEKVVFDKIKKIVLKDR